MPEDVLVAEDAGQVVGYVMLHQSIPVPSHAHVLEINGSRSALTTRVVGWVVAWSRPRLQKLAREASAR